VEQWPKGPTIMAKQFHVNILLLSGQKVTADSKSLYLNGSGISGGGGGGTNYNTYITTTMTVTGSVPLTGTVNFSSGSGISFFLSGTNPNPTIYPQILSSNVLTLSGIGGTQLISSGQYLLISGGSSSNNSSLSSVNPIFSGQLLIQDMDGDYQDIIEATGNYNDYVEISVVNVNTGKNASADFVAANSSNENYNYVNLGINSQNYTGGMVGWTGDGYCYNLGGDFYVGNATTGRVMCLFAGGPITGTNQTTQAEMVVGNSVIGINNNNPKYPLDVSGVGRFSVANLGINDSDVLLITNPTLATVGIPSQESPAINFSGNVWAGKGISTGMAWRIYAQGYSGVSPTSQLRFDSTFGTGIYTEGLFIVNSSGVVLANSGVFLSGISSAGYSVINSSQTGVLASTGWVDNSYVANYESGIFATSGNLTATGIYFGYLSGALNATGGYAQTGINALNSWTGISTGLYYPRSTNPLGYLTSATVTVSGVTGILLSGTGIQINTLGSTGTISTYLGTQFSGAIVTDVPMSAANTFYTIITGNVNAGTYLVCANLQICTAGGTGRTTAKIWNGNSVYAASEFPSGPSGVLAKVTGVGYVSMTAIVSIPTSPTALALSAACTSAASVAKATPYDFNAGTAGTTTTLSAVRLY
jgi:hypothetical protein